MLDWINNNQPESLLLVLLVGAFIYPTWKHLIKPMILEAFDSLTQAAITRHWWLFDRRLKEHQYKNDYYYAGRSISDYMNDNEGRYLKLEERLKKLEGGTHDGN